MKNLKHGLNALFDIFFSIVFIKIIFYYFQNEVTFTNFIQLVLIFMIFLNCWTIEVVHLDRYGNTVVNYFFMFLQISSYTLLFIKNNFSIKYLLATLILIAIIFSLQHIVTYIIVDGKNLILKKITEPFCYIHTGRTFILMLGFIFVDYAYLFIFLAFSLSQLFPSFISRSLHAKDMNFKNLVTRITSLILILTIILFINNIKDSILFNNTILILLIVGYLFLVSSIDKNLTRTSGNTYILGSYFAIFCFFSIEYILKNGVYFIFIISIIVCILITISTYRQYKKSD